MLWKKEKPVSCEDCGECCEGGEIGIVLDKREEALLRASGTILERDELFEVLYMDPDEDAQAFLFGSPCGHHCRDAQGRSSCGVYSERPQACSAFERGGVECLRLRAKREARINSRGE